MPDASEQTPEQQIAALEQRVSGLELDLEAALRARDLAVVRASTLSAKLASFHEALQYLANECKNTSGKSG